MDDDDEVLRPPDAYALTQKQVTEELERRKRKAVGFLDDDQRALQEIFNVEFEAEREERTRERQELRAKQRADEEALRLRRLNERDKREEDEAVAADKRVAFWIDLIERDATPPDMVLRVDPVAFRAFVKALLPRNSSLRTLDACGSKLHDDVGVQLGHVLRSNATSLGRVDLDFNGLGPASLAAIAGGLAANTHLSALSLERNPLTGEAQDDLSGVAALAAALCSNSALRCLNLYHCGLGKEGGRLLADALERAAAAGTSGLVALQLSPTDGIATADLARITLAVRANIRRADEEAQRAAEAAAAAAAAAALAAKSSEEAALALAEDLWIQTQKIDRARARAEAEYAEHRAEVLAEARREAEHKERRERWRAEEEAKAKKKAKKAEKGKKKKK